MGTKVAITAAIIGIGVFGASPAHADEPSAPPAPVAGQQAPSTQGAPNDIPDGDGQVGPYWTGDYSEDIYIFL
jgi:hypothetical protein